MGAAQPLKYQVLFVILGFAAIVAQIILQRRFMVVFGGNELTIGIVFAAWMLWAGIGNFLAGCFADRIKNIPRALAVNFLAISIVLPITVFAASLIKAALGISPSQIMAPLIIIVSTLVLLSPLCLSIGTALVLAAKLPATGDSKDIGMVYIFDSLGCAVGGLLFSWFAIRYLNPLQTSFFVSAILIVGTGLFLQTKEKLLSALLAIGFAALFFTSGRLDMMGEKVQWKGYNPIVNIDSRFGNIVVTENQGEHTLFFDGAPQFSTPLPETYEVAACLPILMHPKPKDVLLIGGGLSGMLYQWRDVDLESITYLQIDPDITAAEEGFMVPKEMFSDPRLQIHYMDGRSYLKRGEGNSYDIIILQTGDPATAATNRYYTEEFFEDVKKKLRPDGIIFFSVFETTNYISPEAGALLGSIYVTLNQVFDHIVVLPLNKYYFVASAEEGDLTDDIQLLGSRLKSKGWHAPSLLTQVLYGVFPERVTQTQDTVIKAAKETKTINTDRHPIAYYAGLVLWAARAEKSAAHFFEIMEKIKVWHVVVLILIAAFFLVIFSRRRSVETASGLILAAVGFSSMVYEMVLLVWYQVKVGLLFYHLGIIIMAFMVGLSVGAYIAISFCHRRSITLLLILFAFYMPLLFFVSSLSFPLANFLCGALAGMIYQLAATRVVEKGALIGKTAGLINFSDYIGAALGALVASVIMIPLFGLFSTLLIATLMLVMAALIYYISIVIIFKP